MSTYLVKKTSRITIIYILRIKYHAPTQFIFLLSTFPDIKIHIKNKNLVLNF
jgi:hypothetical protein